MRQVISDVSMVAFCGLYCGACGAYLKERCPGCKENTKAAWCKIRTCCMDNSYAACADCIKFADVNDCRKFNNFISKIFALIFRSNRKVCIQQIRDKGLEGHAVTMAKLAKHSLSR